jgi:hypothetical protein
LLVKDILIGPDKITIRHRIPTRERTTNSGPHAEETDTEGDHRESCPLRWGRALPALGDRWESGSARVSRSPLCAALHSCECSEGLIIGVGERVEVLLRGPSPS